MEALTLVAAEAPVQVGYLEGLGLGGCADELALELHDSVVLLGELVDQRAISEEAAEAVLMVDRKLDAMSGEKQRQLWTREALQRADSWEEVRRLAAAALVALGSVGSRSE